MKVGVLGGHGFIGSAVVDSLARSGRTPVLLPRVALPDTQTSADSSLSHTRLKTPALVANEHLADALSKVDIVINAAGLADPTSSDHASLWRTNTLLPAVVDVVAREADVDRVVHISSAAVQGDQPLTEEPTWSPKTPYGHSKAEGEKYLLEHATTPTVIYRATSVMGPGRDVVDRLVGFYRRRFVPVFGDGSAPLPLSALPNTSDAIVFLAGQSQSGSIALQPWEGVTQRSLTESLAGERSKVVRLPLGPVLTATRPITNRLPASVVAQVRRVELLVFGQQQEARALTAAGYQPATEAAKYLATLAKL